METALVILGALNLGLSLAALIQAHRAFQSFSTVVQLLRQARSRGR
jgi:hypothetical protein